MICTNNFLFKGAGLFKNFFKFNFFKAFYKFSWKSILKISIKELSSLKSLKFIYDIYLPSLLKNLT